MKRFFIILAVIGAVVVLLATMLIIYAKVFMFVPDKDGMVYKTDVQMRVTPYNSGSDEFGNSVGYGEGDTVSFNAEAGDVFFEDYGDTLLRNPSKKAARDSLGEFFRIKEIDDQGITVVVEKEEQFVAYDDSLQLFSHLQLLDGASTHYTITFIRT